MCELTNKNFDDKCSEILENIQLANFIAIDCEFSGLFDNNCNFSLFETPSERFCKLQNALESFAVIQFGLSTFKYHRSKNSFSSCSYSFYLKPTTFLGSQRLTWLMKSVDFLNKYNFDYNKLFYNGIQYLSKSQEAEILKLIECGELVTDENRDDVTKYCTQVSGWFVCRSAKNEMLLDLEDESQTLVYLLHREIRRRFPCVWTYFDDNKLKQIRIKKVTKEESESLMLNDNEKMYLNNKLFECILGFSKIIKELETSKKPIVGHNILIDLIMIYKQFYNPSRLTYQEFKDSISTTFPNIYDTKTISFRLRDVLSKENTWTSNILQDLYYYFKDGKGSKLVVYSPQITHEIDQYAKTTQFHDAGFDSYSTGYCFIKMAHLFCVWEKGRSGFITKSIPICSAALLGAVSKTKNNVNVARAQVTHIVLDGPDPENIRPRFLFIQSSTGKPLDMNQISELLSKFGAIDLKVVTKYKALLAVANQKQLRDVTECAKTQKNFTLSKYSFFKHSFWGKSIVFGIAMASGTLASICVLKAWLKLSQ